MTTSGPQSPQQPQTKFQKHFSQLEDPRRISKGNLIYPLEEIIFLSISASISGANAWTSIESFGNSKINWLRKFFPFEHGIPSHDTIGDFFGALDPLKFGECFSAWTQEVVGDLGGQVVCIDGKTIRGAASSGSRKYPVHIVTAFAAANRISIGQVATEEKSNEITAIPKLLEMIALKGCIVTIDAIGCQQEIVKSIIKAEAEYILMVKDNQKELREQVEKVIKMNASCDRDETLDAGHGRIETRVCQATSNLTFLDGKEDWKNIKSVVKITSERTIKATGQTSFETKFYITSLEPDAKSLNKHIRSHWAIENNLHWMLDVVFSEDGQLKRNGNSAANCNILSKITLGMIEKDVSKKTSKKGKRFCAALDDDFREKLIFG